MKASASNAMMTLMVFDLFSLIESMVHTHDSMYPNSPIMHCMYVRAQK